MAPGDAPLTFIVRLFPSGPEGVRGVVERVGTGWKDSVQSPEDVARVIAAALAEQRTKSVETPKPRR
jgi:hypothetical protein